MKFKDVCVLHLLAKMTTLDSSFILLVFGYPWSRPIAFLLNIFDVRLRNVGQWSISQAHWTWFDRLSFDLCCQSIIDSRTKMKLSVWRVVTWIRLRHWQKECRIGTQKSTLLHLLIIALALFECRRFEDVLQIRAWNSGQSRLKWSVIISFWSVINWLLANLNFPCKTTFQHMNVLKLTFFSRASRAQIMN